MKYFKNSKFHQKFKKKTKKMILQKDSLPFGQRLIIWLNILRDIYRIRNDSEQIYLFLNISESKSYQLAQSVRQLAKLHFFWNFRPWSRAQRTMIVDSNESRKKTGNREKNAPEHQKYVKSKNSIISPNDTLTSSSWSKITMWIRIWSQINR